MSETLLHEIRATKPEAPSVLRERVRALSAQQPAREPFLDRIRFTWGWRQLALAVPATAVVALLAAGVIGYTRDNGGDRTASGGAATELQTFESAPAQSKAAAPPATRALLPAASDSAGSTVAPAPGQLQRFEAELGLRVDDVNALSDATKRAQQIARDHGGSVASLQYDAPSTGVGTAQITLRIPTAQVEAALAELSQLGTIVGQRYGIQDLQQQADSLQTQIEQTQRRIAQILTQLESPTLSNENRVVLQSRLNASRQKLAGLRESLRSTRAEAATATVNVTLTTEKIGAAPVGGSRLDGIRDVLAWEAVGVLYFLVVAGPFIVLGVLAWLILRLRRRHVETRLLQQN